MMRKQKKERKCRFLQVLIVVLISVSFFIGCDSAESINNPNDILVIENGLTENFGDAVLDGLYAETHRPQFHFSPPTNWMNDPNGMVYYEGEYHLFYQYYPYGNVWGPMHWGHAVSTDMMKWKDLPIALYPDSLGQIFSGSAVIDKYNTAGFQTGDEKVMVAIYTSHSDTYGQQQSIAYSNDKGRTWVKYEGNPVIPNPGIADFRDPKVIWHEATQKWIMLLAAGDKIILYKSSNLKNWQYASEFGASEGSHGGVWECPDLIRLEVDNSGQYKWVMIVSAAGSPAGGTATQYFIGNFDGTTFTNDNSPSTVLWLDYGKDNYAGVTWSNTPDGRQTYIGWMSNWQYATVLPTSVWRSNMTLPRTLGLTEIDNNVVLKQNIVSEFNNYRDTGSSRSWYNKTIYPGQNLLSSLSGKSYEIVVEFQDSTSSASEYGIKVRTGNGQFTTVGYNRSVPELFVDRRFSGNTGFHSAFSNAIGQHMVARNGKVTMRIIVDRGSVEVIGNDGLASITELIFPDSGSTGIDLYTIGGNVKVNSLKYYPISGAVPEQFGEVTAASGVIVDDSSVSQTYTGNNWTRYRENIYYNSTCAVTNQAGSSIEQDFYGTDVYWYGLKNNDLGIADVYIDGSFVESVDCYSGSRSVQKLFERTNLSNSSHTIKVVVTGNKNGSSSGTFIVHDAFKFPKRIDDASSENNYSGSWTRYWESIYYNNTCYVTNQQGAFVEYGFTGKTINWYGLKNSDLGIADVYIDGVKYATVDCYSSNRSVQKLFSVSNLSEQDHVIKVVVTGNKNGSSSGTFIVHDSFAY